MELYTHYLLYPPLFMEEMVFKGGEGHHFPLHIQLLDILHWLPFHQDIPVRDQGKDRHLIIGAL